jgi:hypothetical protein
MTPTAYYLSDLERTASDYLARFDVPATVYACWDGIVLRCLDSFSADDVFTIVEDHLGATPQGVDEWGRMTYTVPARDLFHDVFYVVVSVRA